MPASRCAERTSGERDDWRATARGQFGLIEYHQLARCGVSRQHLATLTKRGELERVLPRVYRLTASPRSWNQALVAAWLWAGVDAAVSDGSAALLLGLDGVRGSPIELTVPRYRPSPNASIRLHRRDVKPRDLCRIGVITATNMPRTIIDLAASLDEYALDLALDSAIRRFMEREDFMKRVDELRSSGRDGMRKLGKLVAERESEQGLTESAFERKLLRVLRRAGLPEPVCQFPFADGKVLGRIDFAYPEFGIAIEADGYRWHDGRAAFERDRARCSELASRGWRVLLITWLQLKYQPQTVIARIRRALATPGIVSLRPG